MWPARLVLQGHEAPQVLKEREVALVSAEPLGMPGPQVSDGRSQGRAPVPLCPPGAVDGHPSATTNHHVRAGVIGVGASMSKEGDCWALGAVCIQGE